MLSGCSSLFSGSEDADAYRELSDMRRSGIGTAEEFKQREEAKRLFASRLYLGAITAFENLRDTYPLSSFSEFYTAKTADAYFELGRYDEAATQYQELFTSAQRSTMRPYYALQSGKSHLLAYRGVGRDIKPVRESITYFGEAQQLSTNQEFSEEIEQLLAQAQHALAEYERQIIDFYQRSGNAEAVKARLAKLDAGTPDTAEEMLRILAVNCLSEPIPTLVFEFSHELQPNHLSELPGEGEIVIGPVGSVFSSTQLGADCIFDLARVSDSGPIKYRISSNSEDQAKQTLRTLALSSPARLFIFSSSFNEQLHTD
jgi:hypothetical protein